MTDPVPTQTCRLILIRHGQTDDNRVWRLSGWTDSPLNERGQRQARLLAYHLAGHWRLDAIYASPLQRAAETARAIANRTGLDPIHRHDLREMHFGACEGLTDLEWKARYPELIPGVLNETDQAFRWPGGESRDGFHRRVQSVFGELARRHAGEAIAVVCHGGLISSYLCSAAGRPLSDWREFMVHNCSLSVVQVDVTGEPPRPGILVRNHHAHLEAIDGAAA